MMEWLSSHVFTNVIGWLGLAGVLIAACLAVAWFIPPLRRYAIGIAMFIGGVGFVYAKGVRDQEKLERERDAQAVKKAREKYDEIDNRPTDDSTVDKRLRDRSF